MSQPDVATNVSKLQELSKDREEAEKELEELYNKWEELSL